MSRVLTYLWSVALIALALIGPDLALAQETPAAESVAAEAAQAEAAPAAEEAADEAPAAEAEAEPNPEDDLPWKERRRLAKSRRRIQAPSNFTRANPPG